MSVSDPPTHWAQFLNNSIHVGWQCPFSIREWEHAGKVSYFSAGYGSFELPGSFINGSGDQRYCPFFTRFKGICGFIFGQGSFSGKRNIIEIKVVIITVSALPSEVAEGVSLDLG